MMRLESTQYYPENDLVQTRRRDPHRIFYESLYKQVRTSEIVQIWVGSKSLMGKQQECISPASRYSPYTPEFKCPAPGGYRFANITRYASMSSYHWRGGRDPSPPPQRPMAPSYSPPGYPLPEPKPECYAPPLSPTTSPEPEPECYSPPPLSLFTGLPTYGSTGLLARIALHCYHLHQGPNLQYLDIQMFCDDGLFGKDLLIAAWDPIRNTTCNIDTEIFSHNNHCGSMDLTITRCSLHPEVERCCNKTLVVDDLFQGYELSWLPEDALTGNYKLQYYEMKESEVEQDKEWLHLYAQLAVFASGILPCFTGPDLVELRKVVVQTTEDVEPMNKAKATNAIFYISFKHIGGQDYNAIIRRTTVDWPEHMKLDVKCV